MLRIATYLKELNTYFEVWGYFFDRRLQMYTLETITAAELQDLLGSKKSHHGLKVIDARWDDTKLRTSIREEYDKEHIPFSIFYNH